MQQLGIQYWIKLWIKICFISIFS